MKICKEFYFDAAHHLIDYKGKCERVHGHTYKLEVVIEGEVGKDGMVMDFVDIKETVEKEIIGKLDHRDLNDIFENPTSENMAKWIFERLKKEFGNLSTARLWEGRNSWVEYDGS